MFDLTLVSKVRFGCYRHFHHGIEGVYLLAYFIGWHDAYLFVATYPSRLAAAMWDALPHPRSKTQE